MPASDLGVWVVLAQGRAVVTRVAEASVAAEDEKVKLEKKFQNKKVKFRLRLVT